MSHLAVCEFSIIRRYYSSFTYSFTPFCLRVVLPFFFFNDTATTEIYTLSLHDALPIWSHVPSLPGSRHDRGGGKRDGAHSRSEEHTSELQSHSDLVCRLLLEKKKKNINTIINKNGNLTYQEV